MSNVLCPLDGRYKDSVGGVSMYFSDFQLTKNKVCIEIEYFIMFMEAIGNQTQHCRRIYKNFDESDYQKIQQIEKVVRHDIKAVQVFVQQKLRSIGYTNEDIEMVHWGLTSQDVVSVSYYMAVQGFRHSTFEASMSRLKDACGALISRDTKPMMAYTHGQPAVPTTFSREIGVFMHRLQTVMEQMNDKFVCKFGGAIGTLAGHYSIYPGIDWDKKMDEFCQSAFELSRCKKTTQIDNYQSLSHFLSNVRDIANILIDMNGDMWLYAFNNTISIKPKKEETGSSTMPQKINPIKFENSEGNLQLCSSLINFFIDKLSKSRLQRDLSDSTVMRNIGLVFGYFTVGVDSLVKGLEEIYVANPYCEDKVYMEYIQLYLKSKHYIGAYELIKDVSRTNEDITIIDVINKLVDVVKPEHISEMITNIQSKDFYLGNAAIR